MSLANTKIFLAELLGDVADNSYVPYSNRKQACILIGSDGQAVPGARVENASYPLTITAFQNAWSTWSLHSNESPKAAVFHQTLDRPESAFISELFPSLKSSNNREFLSDPNQEPPKEVTLLDPRMDIGEKANKDLLALSKDGAKLARVAESNFPVSTLLSTEQGKAILAGNVESAYWPFILCAERNAISTAITWGMRDINELFLYCPQDQSASPCGACRQVIMEMAAKAVITMDRGNEPPEQIFPVDLLPGPFLGETLRR